MWFAGDRNVAAVAADDDDAMSITSDEERNLINEIEDDDSEDLSVEMRQHLEVYRLLLSTCFYKMKRL